MTITTFNIDETNIGQTTGQQDGFVTALSMTTPPSDFWRKLPMSRSR